MKLSLKTAGLFATGTFIVLSYTVLFYSGDPLRVLFVALPGGFVALVLGYVLGKILETPRGKRR